MKRALNLERISALVSEVTELLKQKGIATEVSVKLDPSAYFVNFVHCYIKKIA